jgi:hypothetical protein
MFNLLFFSELALFDLVISSSLSTSLSSEVDFLPTKSKSEVDFLMMKPKLCLCLCSWSFLSPFIHYFGEVESCPTKSKYTIRYTFTCK